MEKVDYVTERTKNGLDHIEHQKAGHGSRKQHRRKSQTDGGHQS